MKHRLKRGQIVSYRHSIRAKTTTKAIVEKVTKKNIHARRIDDDRMLRVPIALVESIDDTVDIDAIALDKVRAELEEFKSKCSLPKSKAPDYLVEPERYYYTSEMEKGRQRDRYKTKVYRAEARAEKVVGSGEQFRDIADCARYGKEVITSKWVRDRFGDVDLVIESNNSKRVSYARDGLIRLMQDERHMNELTILHEIAHVLTPRSAGGHCALWRAIYVDLLRAFMGDHAADTMGKNFRIAGLNFTGYRSSPF